MNSSTRYTAFVAATITVSAGLVHALGGASEAVVFEHVKNVSRYDNMVERKDDGWFAESIETISRTTGLRVKAAETAIDNLLSLGVVQRIVDPFTGIAWLRVNLDALLDLVEGGEVE